MTFISFPKLVIVLLCELEVLPSKAECWRGEEIGSTCYSIGICRLSVAAKERSQSSFYRGGLQRNSHKVSGRMIQYHQILSLMVQNKFLYILVVLCTTSSIMPCNMKESRKKINDYWWSHCYHLWPTLDNDLIYNGLNLAHKQEITNLQYKAKMVFYKPVVGQKTSCKTTGHRTCCRMYGS